METPFNMLIVDMTCCGKTYYLLKMSEKEYYKHFDFIFLICPTFEYNKTYQNWKYKNDKKFIVIPCQQDEVDSYLKYIINFSKGTNSLVILDDCAASQDVKNRTSELVNLGFSARHFGLSTIVITQKFASISKPYRDNISKIVTFFNPDEEDAAVIFKKYIKRVENKDELAKILENNKYARLEITLRVPKNHKIIVP